MKVPVEHRVDFLLALDGKGTVVIGRILDGDGKILQSTVEVPVVPGESITFGLVSLDVDYPGKLETASTPAGSTTPHPTVPAKPGTVAPPKPAPR
jgi:hypothetical protein